MSLLEGSISFCINGEVSSKTPPFKIASWRSSDSISGNTSVNFLRIDPFVETNTPVPSTSLKLSLSYSRTCSLFPSEDSSEYWNTGINWGLFKRSLNK